MSKKNIESKMQILLENLKFSECKDMFVSELPLGWKQKLAFGVASIAFAAYRVFR